MTPLGGDGVGLTVVGGFAWRTWPLVTFAFFLDFCPILLSRAGEVGG